MLPPGSHLQVPCGEVTFDLQPAEPAATLPRPWLPAGWRAGVKYPLAVAIVLGLLLAIAHLIPSDPRALSLDTLDASGRMARLVTVPLEVTAPEIDHARALTQAAGGSGSAAAAKPSGQAGDRRSHETSHHMTIRGTARPQDARAVAAQIHDNSLLAVLDGPRTSAFAEVLTDGPRHGRRCAGHRRKPGRLERRPRVRRRWARTKRNRPRRRRRARRDDRRRRAARHDRKDSVAMAVPTTAIGPGVGGLHTRHSHVPRGQLEGSAA